MMCFLARSGLEPLSLGHLLTNRWPAVLGQITALVESCAVPNKTECMMKDARTSTYQYHYIWRRYILGC